MNNLAPVKHSNQLILTTEQLAEVYGTNAKTIANNFNRNKSRYTQSKHYYLLEGNDLKEFRTIHQNDDYSKNTPKLYLWTERGALLHAKSLNTDKAWQVYESLLDNYFNQKTTPQILDTKLITLANGNKATQEYLLEIKLPYTFKGVPCTIVDMLNAELTA